MGWQYWLLFGYLVFLNLFYIRVIKKQRTQIDDLEKRVKKIERNQ